MEELTIEQKAQAYNKAIEIAKEWYSDALIGIGFKANLEKLFPMLKDKESEDERIRKTTIAFLKEFVDRGYENAVECIDWLEKQEQTDSIIEKSKTEKQRVLITETDGNANIDWDTRSLEDAKRLLECGLRYINTELEKQGADKVEPKFKVGDWIVYNRNDNSKEIIQIYDIRDGRYYFTDNVHFSWSVKECDEKSHLWTIQDAKDGDVLAIGSWLYIFEYTNNKAMIKFHCTCPIKGKPFKWCFSLDETHLDTYKDANIHPATKEERDLMFQKMREEGYKWDAEKKKLKRIVPKFHAGEWIVWNGKFYKVNYNGCGYELIDQNGFSTSLDYRTVDCEAHIFGITDASDGDVLTVENMVFVYKTVLASHIVSYCKLFNNKFELFTDARTCCDGNSNVHPATKEERDLMFQKMREEGYKWDVEKKELKKIEQNTASWTKEDSIKIGTLSGIICDYAFLKDALDENNDLIGEYAELEKWLESFPERLNIQPKQAYSEEDELMLKQAIYVCHQNGYTAVENWLKSLYEQLKSL